MSEVSLNYTTLDVFTEQRFSGNQLAVVDVPSDIHLSQDEKQRITREFNYSETVFLHEPESGNSPQTQSGATWSIDIFTLESELPFAGHPVIGTACLLAQRHPSLSGVTLVTKAGPIPITYASQGAGQRYASAAIPHNSHLHTRPPPESIIAEQQPGLWRHPSFNGLAGVAMLSIVKGMTFVLVGLKSRTDLLRVSTCTVKPDSYHLDDAWAESFVGTYYYWKDPDAPQGVIRLHTRMVEGALEDPATGSAACTLSAFLSSKMEPENIAFEIVQGEDMGRKSSIKIQASKNSNGDLKTLSLQGSAVQVMRGSLTM